MFNRNIFLAVALAAGTAVAASAQDTVAVQSGVSPLTLSSSLAATLQNLGVTFSVVSPAVETNGVVNLPIVGGAFDLDTSKGELFHTGGLVFTRGNMVITVTDLLIDTTDAQAGATTPVVSALVVANGVSSGRLPLFNLGKPAGFQLPVPLTDKFIFNLNGSALTLNAGAAAELDAFFGVSTLTGGLSIGSVNTVVVIGKPF
jgi:hypothetical protein